MVYIISIQSYVSFYKFLMWVFLVCQCSFVDSVHFFFRFHEDFHEDSDYFEKNAHKIAKSKYLPDILNDSDSPINSLSDDI